jgi:hypothetical protein
VPAPLHTVSVTTTVILEGIAVEMSVISAQSLKGPVLMLGILTAARLVCALESRT